jgi:hypothetical protein
VLDKALASLYQDMFLKFTMEGAEIPVETLKGSHSSFITNPQGVTDVIL